MMLTRRSALLSGLVSGLATASLPLIGCTDGQKTRVYVMGVIHSNHRTSERYSLAVLEAAIRKAEPDVVLTEIPPDRIDRAISSFRATGEIDEPRTQVFPEYTDVLFPLSAEMRFDIMGTAGWTQEIADNRRAALAAIEADPARAEQWAEHRAAQRDYARGIAGRGDDPRFVHTGEFDQLVEKSREPYQRHFDADLGPGGWNQINAAHTGHINSALDTISGKGLTALITFGSAHKYLILRSLAERGDIALQDTAKLFN